MSQNFPFSNFQELDTPITDSYGIEYPTVEHYYQASKSLAPTVRKVVAAQPTAAMAKKVGQGLAIRPDWPHVKEKVMLRALRVKFAEGTTHAAALMGFEGEIVEWNRWHDNYWGRCTCPRCRGLGTNRLGVLLMQVRDELLGDEFPLGHMGEFPPIKFYSKSELREMDCPFPPEPGYDE